MRAPRVFSAWYFEDSGFTRSLISSTYWISPDGWTHYFCKKILINCQQNNGTCYDIFQHETESYIVTVGNTYILPFSRTKRELSLHARKRSRQRGLSQGSAALVVAFGEPEYDHQGGIRYLMTAKSLENLRRTVGNTQQVDALAGVYAVVSANDPTVITLAHRH